MSKATEEALATLHGAVAVALTDGLSTREVTRLDKEGEAVTEDVPPTPAMIMAAITFLKNNNITADASSNAELSELQKALSERRTRSKARLTARDLDEAAAVFERDLGGLQ